MLYNISTLNLYTLKSTCSEQSISYCKKTECNVQIKKECDSDNENNAGSGLCDEDRVPAGSA